MVRSLILLSLLASACRSRTDNHLLVSNPLPAGNLFPEVVQIVGYDWSRLDYPCSGVFISPRLLLTAAHCVYSAQGGGLFSMTYTSPNGVVHQGKMFPAPQYQKDGDVLYNTRFDLALISFDTDLAPAVARIAPTTTITGETVTIVGYGETDWVFHGGQGTKNLGHNRIQTNEGNISMLSGFIRDRPLSPRGQESLSAKGDSGGGMFNQRGELSGIVSSGQNRMVRDNRGNLLGNSYMVNLAHPESTALLNAINANFCAGKSLKPGEACQGSACGIQ